MFKDVRMSELYCWKKSRTQRVKSWEVGKISSILWCLEGDNKMIEIEFVNLDLFSSGFTNVNTQSRNKEPETDHLTVPI